MNYNYVVNNITPSIDKVSILDTSFSTFPQLGKVSMKRMLDEMRFDCGLEVYSRVEGKEINFSTEDIVLSQFIKFIENIKNVPERPVVKLVNGNATILENGRSVPFELSVVRNKDYITLDFILQMDESTKYVIELTSEMANAFVTFLVD